MAHLADAVTAIACLVAGAVTEGTENGAAGAVRIRTGNGTTSVRRRTSTGSKVSGQGVSVAQVLKGGVPAPFPCVGKDKSIAVVNGELTFVNALNVGNDQYQVVGGKAAAGGGFFHRAAAGVVAVVIVVDGVGGGIDQFDGKRTARHIVCIFLKRGMIIVGGKVDEPSGIGGHIPITHQHVVEKTVRVLKDRTVVHRSAFVVRCVIR